MRKYVTLKKLRSIYFSSFDSYLSHCCLVWTQNCSAIQRIITLQKKAIRIFNQESSILKFQDKICLENILFISKSINNLSPSVFNTWFSFSSDQRNYEAWSSTQGNLIKNVYKTKRYGNKCCWVMKQNPKTIKRFST